MNSSPAKVVRWDWLHYTLFVSVAVAAVLFIPVLFLKMNLFDDGAFLTFFAFATKFLVVVEQILASLSVPFVGINLLRMVRKLKRIEGLQDKLELLSAGGHVLAEPPKGGLPAVVEAQVVTAV
jgi:hypothetical protein